MYWHDNGRTVSESYSVCNWRCFFQPKTYSLSRGNTGVHVFRQQTQFPVSISLFLLVYRLKKPKIFLRLNIDLEKRPKLLSCVKVVWILEWYTRGRSLPSVGIVYVQIRSSSCCPNGRRFVRSHRSSFWVFYKLSRTKIFAKGWFSIGNFVKACAQTKGKIPPPKKRIVSFSQPVQHFFGLKVKTFSGSSS